MRLFYLFFVFIFLFPIAGYSQSYKSIKAEADKLFDDGFFELAVERYEECFREKPTDYDMSYHLGVGYLMLNRLHEAETVLSIIYNNKKGKFVDVTYYLGYLHHRKLDFEKAAKYYKEFFNKNNLKDFESLVKVKLRNCESGMLLKKKNAIANVDLLPEPINSTDDDFHPILSPSRSLEKIYFSSNRLGVIGGLRDDHGKIDKKHGHRNPDMFTAELKPVIKTERMSGLLNTSLFDEVIGFSADGSSMYYKKGFVRASGLLYEDKYTRSSKERISGNLLEVPFDMQQGDASPYFFMDTMVIFASRRLEGFGGYDLFYSNRTPDGWTEPINMGANINSPYDEKYPFLTNNKESLYFSSNKPQGIGGDDIYKAVYSPILKRWNKGKNLGIPINSADDDQHFQMANDGWHFVFSSNRHESIGKHDIFEGQFFEQQADQVVMTMAVESDQILDTSLVVSEAVLFQSFAMGTIIPDSQQFAELNRLAQMLNAHPEAILSARLTRTSHSTSAASKALDPLATVILSFLKTNAPNTKVSFTQTLLAPKLAKNPGKFLDIFVLAKDHESSLIQPINNVKINSFVPRISKNIRYKIEVADNSKGLQDFLAANKYDFSFTIDEDDEFHLLYGTFLTFETAQQWAEQLFKNDMQVVKIIPCISDHPLSASTNEALLNQYPSIRQHLLK